MIRRLLAALAHRRHDDPHYECRTTPPGQPCDGLNDPGVGHVCVCGCRRCDLSIRRDYDICVCRGCDARVCGLHEGVPADSYDEEMR
jgi:hypothetical protein